MGHLSVYLLSLIGGGGLTFFDSDDSELDEEEHETLRQELAIE